MATFGICVILFHICCTVTPVLYLTRALRLNWYNPNMCGLIVGLPAILLQLMGPIFLDISYLSNPYYQFGILMAALYLLMQIFLTVGGVGLARRIIARYPALVDRTSRLQLSTRALTVIGWVCFCLFWVVLLAMAARSIGIGAWLLHPREGYMFGRVGNGHLYILATSFFSISFILQSLVAKNRVQVLVISGLHLILAYFLGSKGTILSGGLYALTVLWLKREPRMGLFISGGLLGMISLMIGVFFGSGSAVDMVAILEYFDHYINGAMYYEAYFQGSLPLYYGEVLLSSFWGMVPRFIEPEKPFVYGITKVVDIFYPGATEKGFTPAFGGAVQQFSDFGVIGVAGAGLLNLLWFTSVVGLYIFYERNRRIAVKPDRIDPLLLVLLFWFFAPSFLVMVDFPLSSIAFFCLVGTIILLGFLRITPSQRERG